MLGDRVTKSKCTSSFHHLFIEGIINDFSINKKFLQEFKDINKKYNNVSVEKFKYTVDKNIKNINN